jgi:hypothetical protein
MVDSGLGPPGDGDSRAEAADLSHLTRHDLPLRGAVDYRIRLEPRDPTLTVEGRLPLQSDRDLKQ